MSLAPLVNVLAHQGGWDEIALVAVPIVMFAALLWLANRRANAAIDSSQTPGEPDSDTEPSEERSE